MHYALTFRTIVLISAPLFFVCATMAHAHSLGASFEQTVGEHLIDIGYEPSVMKAGRYVRFDFELWKGERGVPRDYEYVWVRLLKEDHTIFAGGIYRQDIGPTTLLYTFDEAGSYVLEASYRTAEGTTIAEAPLSLTIEDDASPLQRWWPIGLAAIVGLAAGFAARTLGSRVRS